MVWDMAIGGGTIWRCCCEILKLRIMAQTLTRMLGLASAIIVRGATRLARGQRLIAVI